MAELLIVDDLQVRHRDPRGRMINALNGVSLLLQEGAVLGVLGESGSGKSTLARVLLRMLPKNAEVVHGTVEFEGRNLLGLGKQEMKDIRGGRIAIIPQEPGMALNPVIKVGDQIAEVFRAHRGWSGQRCRSEAESILEQVNLRRAGRRMYDAYPHQLSGGQQQRVVIAQAIACNPSLIIADEPTASLDFSTEAEILGLFRQLKAERKTSLLLITHDPGILPDLADRVAVMYAGRVVEEGPSDKIFRDALHPYAKALLACLPPPVTRRPRGYRLSTIAGAPPDAAEPASGCSFAPRCAESMERCRSVRPVAQAVEEKSRVECFLYDR
jgi:oligopeptide/dipeptide ABC transporter ATP-binding protein